MVSNIGHKSHRELPCAPSSSRSLCPPPPPARSGASPRAGGRGSGGCGHTHRPPPHCWTPAPCMVRAGHMVRIRDLGIFITSASISRSDTQNNFSRQYQLSWRLIQGGFVILLQSLVKVRLSTHSIRVIRSPCTMLRTPSLTLGASPIAHLRLHSRTIRTKK